MKRIVSLIWVGAILWMVAGCAGKSATDVYIDTVEQISR